MSRPLPNLRRSPGRERVPVRLNLEGLEDRATPSISADLVDGTLLVQGDDKNNHILIEQRNNGDITVSGGGGRFDKKDVQRVEVHGGGGNDFIEFGATNHGNKEKLGDWLYGDDGDDTIVSGDGADMIFGGAGNDLLDGGAGKDQLAGDGGDDTLFGGDGADHLSGGDGNDSLNGEDGSDYLSGGAGSDLFRGGDGRDTFKDNFQPDRWQVNGYSPQDVQQGSGGTCSVLATLAASAAAGEGLTGRITYLGNDTYKVKLYSSWFFGLFHTSSSEEVYFDGTWYDHDAQPTRQRDGSGSPTGPLTGDFWTTLFQRAVLQHEDKDWRDPKSIEDWALAEEDAHSAILGDRDSSSIDKSDAGLAAEMRAALRRGSIVTAGTRDFGKDESGEEIVERDGIVSVHAYAVLDVYQQQGEWRVRVYNPWGWDNTADATDARDDGIVDMSWQTFVNNFEIWCRTDL